MTSVRELRSSATDAAPETWTWEKFNCSKTEMSSTARNGWCRADSRSLSLTRSLALSSLHLGLVGGRVVFSDERINTSRENAAQSRRFGREQLIRFGGWVVDGLDWVGRLFSCMCAPKDCEMCVNVLGNEGIGGVKIRSCGRE